MTRDEWYESNDFKLHRMIHNGAAEITQQLQLLDDMLAIFVERHPNVVAYDKYTLVCRAMRLVHAYDGELRNDIRKMLDLFEPKTFDEPKGASHEA